MKSWRMVTFYMFVMFCLFIVTPYRSLAAAPAIGIDPTGSGGTTTPYVYADLWTNMTDSGLAAGFQSPPPQTPYPITFIAQSRIGTMQLQGMPVSLTGLNTTFELTYETKLPEMVDVQQTYTDAIGRVHESALFSSGENASALITFYIDKISDGSSAKPTGVSGYGDDDTIGPVLVAHLVSLTANFDLIKTATTAGTGTGSYDVSLMIDKVNKDYIDVEVGTIIGVRTTGTVNQPSFYKPTVMWDGTSTASPNLLFRIDGSEIFLQGPCIDLKKQISTDGGTTWLEADSQATAAVVTTPHGALYRLIVTNCGKVDLANVTINDPALGITDYSVGNLAARSSVTLTSVQIPALNQPQRCQTPGPYENVATVTGTDSNGNKATASNSAWLVCTPMPCIDLKKQISVDGGTTWLDADTQLTAAIATAPHGAIYRLIVTNCGPTDLINLVVNDAVIGITDFSIGNLSVGASVTITSATIPALDQPLRCQTPGPYENNATVSGKDTNGVPASASNAAWLVCTPTPCLDLKKQISVDGGKTWLDADNLADAANIPAPHGAIYQLIVTNCGTADLTNVIINDPVLGIKDYVVGALAAGASVTLTLAEIPALNQPQRCQTPGPYENIATVTGKDANGVTATVSNAAWLVCTPTPCIKLLKQISVDGGSTWLDADTQTSAAKVTAPHSALYRLIVTNCGNIDLVNVIINDPSIGISNYLVGNLAVKASLTLTAADIPALNQPQRCQTPGPYPNTANVTGNDVNGTNVSATDPAWLVCTPPPCIDIKKQISVDNGATWFDADTQASAANAPAPHGALYRLIVSNCGTVDLTNVTINDPTIGVTNYLVGDLVVKASVTLTAAEIPALDNHERCQTPGPYENIATASGKDANGVTVTASNPAWLVCTPPPPPPCITIKKQISANCIDKSGEDDKDEHCRKDEQKDNYCKTHSDCAYCKGNDSKEYFCKERQSGEAHCKWSESKDDYCKSHSDCTYCKGNGSKEDYCKNEICVPIWLDADTPETAALLVRNSSDCDGRDQEDHCKGSGSKDDYCKSHSDCTYCKGNDSKVEFCKRSHDSGEYHDGEDDHDGDQNHTGKLGTAYRLIVNNCGKADLTNVTINDPTLGITDYLVGNLAAGASVTLASAQIPQLQQPNSCCTPGLLVNTACAKGTADSTTVEQCDLAYLLCKAPLSCRVTAGGNKDGITKPCTLKRDGLPDCETCVEAGPDTWGGQAGAQPRIDGNWTHHHKPSKDKSFVFHSNSLFWIGCSDPGCCGPACANADNRQIDFAGIGKFNNQKGFSFPKGDLCYTVHLEDLGEPGPGGRWPSATEPCTHCPGTPVQQGDYINCTDYYEIKIYDSAAHDSSGHCTGKVTYVNGPGAPQFCGVNDPHLNGYFIRSGNVQMHPDKNGP